MLRTRPLLLAATLLCGCKDAPSQPADDTLTFNGGTIQLDACGYPVITREGASAPIRPRAMLGADPTPFAVHLGLAADPARSMVVTWRTRDEQTLATTVQFGAGGKTDTSVDGVTFAYQIMNGNAPPVRMHETHLCGLQPDTAYSYRVGGKDASGKEAWSEVYGFRTAPDRARADAQISVVVIGDTRTDTDGQWGPLLAKADAIGKPDLILFSGDAVLLGLGQPYWDGWFDKAADVLHRVPILTADGNHENNAINYYAQFALPGNEEYYAIDYGPIHLTVLNDTPASAGDIAGVQRTFLDADLTAAAAAPWKFVMHHKPAYSIDLTHGNEQTVLDAWTPVFDAHRVDLVLNGHVHGYERSSPIRAMAPQAAPAQGTVYVVSGGGGAPLYDMMPSDPAKRILVASKIYNFVILQVRAGQVQLKAYQGDGTVIDSLTLTK